MINLPEIVGQEEAVKRLTGAIAGERMAHSFLFVGPEGVGRRTTALAFARTILCPDVSAGEDGIARPCGKCEDCRMAAADSHPDLHVVYKELARYHEDSAVRSRKMQSLGIPVIRQFLIGPAGQAPSRGRAKVFIVREAELMNAEAQNAMLKTLEEPPNGVIIILLARRPSEMLPTTVSRCSVIRFGPLPADFVAARLKDAGLPLDEAAFWAGYTGGSLGRALTLSSRGLYEIKRQLLDAIAAMGPAGDPGLGEHIGKLAGKLADDIVAKAKRDDKADLARTLASRQAAGAMLELLASACRDAMKLSVGFDTQLIHADQREAIESLAERFAPAELADVIEQLSEYERILWRNVNPRTVWDNAAITLATGAPLRL